MSVMLVESVVMRDSSWEESSRVEATVVQEELHSFFGCPNDDFQDCLDDFHDIHDAGHPVMELRLPDGVPSGADLLSEVRGIKLRFQPDGTAKLPLTDEVARCRDLMFEVNYPLFTFTRLLGEEQRHAIWTLHAICHTLDTVQTLEELATQKRHLRCVFLPEGMRSSTGGVAVYCALRATLQRYAVIQRPFLDLADGVKKRPEGGFRFQTSDDLMLHCYRTAGVIGIIALPVLAEDAVLEDEVFESAIALGMALQLVDLLNCIGHHWRTHGHLTVPVEVMQRNGVPLSKLEQNLRGQATGLEADPRWQAIMRELLLPIPELLRRAALGGERLPGGGRFAVRAAVRICRRVVAEIEARGYDSLHQRSQMFSWQALGDVAGALWN